MELVLKECSKCKTLKEFWLRNAYEDGFFCKCGYYQIMHNYHGADFEDHLISQAPAFITLDRMLELAREEHLHFDELIIREKLLSFDFNNLSEQKLHEIVGIIIESHDSYRFRKALIKFKDIDAIIGEIAKLNPRIDLPKLRDYLTKIRLPLSEKDVLEMEKMIEEYFYNPEIYTVTDW